MYSLSRKEYSLQNLHKFCLLPLQLLPKYCYMSLFLPSASEGSVQAHSPKSQNPSCPLPTSSAVPLCGVPPSSPTPHPRPIPPEDPSAYGSKPHHSPPPPSLCPSLKPIIQFLYPSSFYAHFFTLQYSSIDSQKQKPTETSRLLQVFHSTNTATVPLHRMVTLHSPLSRHRWPVLLPLLPASVQMASSFAVPLPLRAGLTPPHQVPQLQRLPGLTFQSPALPKSRQPRITSLWNTLPIAGPHLHPHGQFPPFMDPWILTPATFPMPGSVWAFS